MSDPALLEVRALRRYFPVRNVLGIRSGWLKALDDVSFEVHRGETLGVVGESGCGKSTLGKTLIGIHRPTAGEIHFRGREIGGLSRRERRNVARELQYVYQDPGASLDPRWKIRRSLHEPLAVHTDLTRAGRTEKVEAILDAVGLPPGHLDLFPHELSGGQQRRVGLARILTLQPALVILDEPTSGLDVSVQATVLNLFRNLQRAFDLTYVFISHDLGVVQTMCDRIMIMYLGRVMETGRTARVFSAPRHPYTKSLLSAVPRIGGRRMIESFALEGEPSDPAHLPIGCRFRIRCPRAEARCAEHEPELRVGEDGQAAACHFA